MVRISSNSFHHTQPEKNFQVAFLFGKSRACMATCQIKKQRAERLRVVGVSPSRKKTAVCTANDLNYCLHQNQTKKNINFLEKRESPTRDFFYIGMRLYIHHSATARLPFKYIIIFRCSRYIGRVPQVCRVALQDLRESLRFSLLSLL